MPSGSRPAAALDAVTVDGFGTLLELVDPVAGLREALAARGEERSPEQVRDAFRAEAAHYRPRSLRGGDGAGLEALRRECVAVFLEHLGAGIEPAGFVPAFVGSIVFRLADGAAEALASLRSAGLALACVANWDRSLHEHLERLGVHACFDHVVASAEVGFEKPDPRIFEHVLARLRVPPARALHIGDEAVDVEGAMAAGLRFEPVPLRTLPARLGL